MKIIAIHIIEPHLRRLFFDVRQTDGITPALGEAGGQPQICTCDSPVWTDVGISVLVAVGHGRYYADLDIEVADIHGRSIQSRYKSVNTMETRGESAQVIDVADEENAAERHEALLEANATMDNKLNDIKKVSQSS